MGTARASQFVRGVWGLAAASWLLCATRGFAFHSGGVARCEGCHTVHNSFEGAPEVGTMPQFTSGRYLLKGADASSTCLNCHLAYDTAPASYHVASANVAPYDATIPAGLTPGGDFGWLKKTMNVVTGGSLVPDGNDGDRHGHNVVSFDFGFAADKLLTAAPGGTYPAASLSCVSCHDPHGRYRRFADRSYGTSGLPISGSGSYPTSPAATGAAAVGSYRLLGGYGYQPASLTGGYAFTANPPDAVAPVRYNRVETSNTDRALQTLVAYGRGSSEWCANCHPRLHVDAAAVSAARRAPSLVHPAGGDARLSAAVTANYNTYVSSGSVANTGDAFSTLAPYELATDDYEGVLKPFAAGTAPGTWYTASGGNNVTCFTCHRAHASAFPGLLRFAAPPALTLPSAAEWMTTADGAGAAAYDSSTTENRVNLGYSAAQQQTAYYGRPAAVFGPNAKKFCVKCHG